jgi:hypothetical protein
MSAKFLEISSGQNLPPQKFEIVEVQKDHFMLKTKDSHEGLRGTLQGWLESNVLICETGYSHFLMERSSSGIATAYKAENLFIGSAEQLMHWSVSGEKVSKDYGGIMAGYIYSMSQTSDKNCLFLSDHLGS